MTEDAARQWLRDVLGVSRETIDRLGQFRGMLLEENKRQNLVSAATLEHVWARHIVDSAQLLLMIGPSASAEQDCWLDLGTGAGFPGAVIAMLREAPITLVESRRRRTDFLQNVVHTLGLPHASVVHGRLESLKSVPYRVISARAFAPLTKLLSLAHRFSTIESLWLLPKGQSARTEVESVRQTWQGSFHVKPSVTDPTAAIIVASGIWPMGKR